MTRPIPISPLFLCMTREFGFMVREEKMVMVIHPIHPIFWDNVRYPPLPYKSEQSFYEEGWNQASTPPLPFPGGMVVVRGREGMAVMVIQGPLLKNSPFLMGKLLRGRLRRCGSMLQKNHFT